ncbi:STAS domain-containing protein [Sediminibacillus dalangtanensis]|uniref:STAS domain-containing protein n=1 Tax=Sediminibacillus dalangtanensis TaxID=2729421 RepID=A0ABX7VZK2_9BACI|nr:STAS domain-containing protein [Sediminibacillus dalangtanensis]QTN01336.1 STAS domain-containing protein [Sediminibacillus dalangtanensis]
MSVKDFLIQNKQPFEEKLLNEAVNVRDKIEEIRVIGNINLLENALKIVLYVVDGQKDEVVAFARKEGIAWANYSLTLAFKLEWVQAIRRTLWVALHDYELLSGMDVDRERFYETESNINALIDEFLNGFFISYSKYKDELIEAQQEMVENLSVPIIPVTPNVCILPLIGEIDASRVNTIEEKVLMEIGRLRIRTLIMDLSGILEMESNIATNFLKLLDGIGMMGCTPVITGLRPETVRNLMAQDLIFDNKAEIKGTLQQALDEYLVNQRVEQNYSAGTLNLNKNI